MKGQRMHEKREIKVKSAGETRLPHSHEGSGSTRTWAQAIVPRRGEKVPLLGSRHSDPSGGLLRGAAVAGLQKGVMHEPEAENLVSH